MDLQPADDWVDQAERRLRAYANLQRRKKLYDISTVGTRIQTAREVMGMSRHQLAARLGVLGVNVHNWEKGKANLPARHLPGLCASCGVTQAWLTMESDQGGPPLPYEVIRRPKDPSFFANQRKKAAYAKARDELAKMRARIAELQSGRPAEKLPR